MQGTKTFKLAMKNMVKESNLFEITSSSDAEFAADKHDRKSLTGGVILLKGIAVSWICKNRVECRYRQWKQSLWLHPRLLVSY